MAKGAEASILVLGLTWWKKRTDSISCLAWHTHPYQKQTETKQDKLKNERKGCLEETLFLAESPRKEESVN